MSSTKRITVRVDLTFRVNNHVGRDGDERAVTEALSKLRFYDGMSGIWSIELLGVEEVGYGPEDA